VGVEFVIPFYLEDNVGDDIVSGVMPYAIIRRISDNKYYNSSTGLWQDSSYSIPLIHYFEGIYKYNFLPEQQDLYIIKCNEDTFKIRDGVALKTISRLTLLDNLDVAISSRLSSIAFDNKIDIIDTNVDTINSNVSSIKGTIDTNLDATVSSRSVVTDESTWTYGTRTLSPTSVDGVGSCETTIDVTIAGVVASGVTVMVYGSSRVVLLSAETNINGQVLFNLNPGNYIFEFKKESVAYSLEIKRTIPSVANINLDACIAW
jgi:hypothetical protein